MGNQPMIKVQRRPPNTLLWSIVIVISVVVGARVLLWLFR